jgi:hypothetical protein
VQAVKPVYAEIKFAGGAREGIGTTKDCRTETVPMLGMSGCSERTMVGRECFAVKARRSCCWKFSLHFLIWFWTIARGRGLGLDDVNPVRFGNRRPSEISPAMSGTIKSETHNLLEVLVMKRLESRFTGYVVFFRMVHDCGILN